MTPEPTAAAAAPPVEAPAGAPHVASEVDRLLRVLVHRPGRELDRLTLDNKDDLLFDELVWPRRAREEHDAFVAALTARGVEVLYVRDLLGEVLDEPAARETVVDATLATVRLGPRAHAALRAWLGELPGPELAERLIAGVDAGDLPAAPGLRLAQAMRAEHVLLQPLPNHLFARDGSMWIGDQAVVGAAVGAARLREAIHLRAIYEHHPALAAAGGVAPQGGVEDPVLEGGDLLVAGGGCVVVGMGERTSPLAVELLAERLFAAEAATQVIAVAIPAKRATMHLDTIVSFADRGVVCGPAPVVAELEAVRLRPGLQQRLRVDPVELLDALADATRDGEPIEIVDTAGTAPPLAREQWDSGNNLLAVAPGVVIAYERNELTNERLRAAGVEVVEVPGGELGRGRGGPRCMSCPVQRERPAAA